jgi:hypothetical protein
MLEQVQPGNPVSMSSSSPDHPQPRSKDEVNRDLAAYEAALNAGKSEESKEDKKEPPKDEGSKKKSDDEWWDWQENDPLSNNKRRKSIEARLKSMAVEDLLMHGEVKQTVHIIPGKLAVVFRSASVDEDMEVKRMMFGVQGTDLYISNRYSMMQLTTSLYSIVTPSGEDVLPNHLDSDKNFNEDLFNKKFAHVKKWPTQFAQDLVNNYIWFDDRVKKLFVAEDLGNG